LYLHITDTVYKLCAIVYKCLHQSAPEYLEQLCLPVMNSASRRRLRSAAYGDLQVPTTPTVTYGPVPPSSAGTVFQPHLDTLHWHWHSFIAG